MAGLSRQVEGEALVRRLFAEHGNAMLAYATRLTGDRRTAEAVFQEALVCAWRNQDSIGAGKCGTRRWLLTTVDRLAQDRAGAAVPEFRTYRTWRLTGTARRRWP